MNNRSNLIAPEQLDRQLEDGRWHQVRREEAVRLAKSDKHQVEYRNVVMGRNWHRWHPHYGHMAWNKYRARLRPEFVQHPFKGTL